MLVWLNGRVVPGERARVSVLDRGLLHGDGVYDTWRTYGGEPFAVPAHLRRLAEVARLMALPAPGPARDWEERTRTLVRRNRLPDAAVRLTITRGARGLDLAPHGDAPATLLLTVRALPSDLGVRQARGIRAVLLPFPRDADGLWGNRKFVGHPSAVLGRLLVARRRAAEGLYVTERGEVTEGTTSNLFVVERETVITPPLAAGILPGVTRDLVLTLARRAGLRVREERLTVQRLRRAHEVFVTGSSIEVMPIVRLDGRAIGTGVPGAVTRRLQERYARRVAAAIRR